MTNRFLSNLLGLALIAGLSAMGIAVVRAGALQPLAAQSLAVQAQAGNDTIGGIYSGQTALKFTLGGVYSDTLATPAPPPAGTPAPADVGQIDLSLFLSQTGSAVSGYVNLDKTLVFSVEHTIQATPVGVNYKPGQPTPAPVVLKTGPNVYGTFDGTTLNLQSERVNLVVAGRNVQRQFRITGALKPGDSNVLVGEFRETVWGYAAQPLTVLGNFVINRPPMLGVPGAGNAVVQAAADSGITTRGKAVTLNVLTNDTGPTGDTLTIISVSVPQHGSASISGNAIVYTPAAGFAGVDRFSYAVSNGKGSTAVGSVSVRVIGPMFLPLIQR